MIKIGILGFSHGNGHPYSFAAIINGFDYEKLCAAGWAVIADYLKVRAPEEIGFKDVSVTHAWSENYEKTQQLCEAVFIKNPCQKLEDMAGAIDAAIIARDDWNSHLELARFFLERGLPVFVDKPLTLNPSDLEFFLSYIDQGLLMSCSGFRYSPEVENLRKNLKDIGSVKLINAVVVNDFEKYGVHMLEAIESLFADIQFETITKLSPAEEFYHLRCSNGVEVNLCCIGRGGKIFRLSVFGESGFLEVDINDNFSAFKRTLAKFIEMVRTGAPAIPSRRTKEIIRALISGSA